MAVILINSYTVASCFLVVAIITLVAKLSQTNRPKGTRDFPGPIGLPWIGRVHDVPISHQWFKFKEWADVYGSIYQTKMLGKNHVWISSEKIATELLSKRGLIYSDRPAIPNIDGSKTRGEYLPLLGYNDAWKRQRKYGHHIMAQGYEANYHDYPMIEAKFLLYRLLHEPTKYSFFLDQFTGRIISRLAWGRPEPAADLKKNAFALLHGISPAGPPSNVFPALMLLPEFLAPWKKEERVRHKWEEGFYCGLQNDVKLAMAEKRARPSWTRTYFEQKEFFGFDEHEAAYAVGMMALAGVQTVGSPLNTFILAMVLHPEWQAKMRNEIDEVCGDRMPTMSDQPNMPILRAILKEVLRWRPPVPTGIPHESQKDDVWEGHFIPKGSYIHPVEWAMSRDVEMYPQPDSFNPDRWLNPKYPTYKEPLSQYPTILGHTQFGFGRRVCQGQDIVNTEMTHACGGIIWAFTLGRSYDAQGKMIPIPAYDYSTLLITRPLQFSFDLKPRSDERMKQIIRNWEEANRLDTQGQPSYDPSFRGEFEGKNVYY